jgi:hypothetical protein
MIVALACGIGFLVPKAAAPQSEFVTKIMHSPSTLPEYRGGNQTASGNDRSALPSPRLPEFS